MMNDSKQSSGAHDDLLRLDEQLCFPLYAATNLLQRAYRPLLAPLGLTYSQYLVMLLLWEKGSTSVGGLGTCLHLDVGTLSPLLKRMERAGLVSRQRDADDERRVVVALTAQGHALREEAAGVPQALMNRIAVAPGDGIALRDQARKVVGQLVAAVSQADNTVIQQ